MGQTNHLSHTFYMNKNIYNERWKAEIIGRVIANASNVFYGGLGTLIALKLTGII